MGKGKSTSTTSSQPWIPTEEQFNLFSNNARSSITPEFQNAMLAAQRGYGGLAGMVGMGGSSGGSPRPDGLPVQPSNQGPVGSAVMPTGQGPVGSAVMPTGRGAAGSARGAMGGARGAARGAMGGGRPDGLPVQPTNPRPDGLPVQPVNPRPDGLPVQPVNPRPDAPMSQPQRMLQQGWGNNRASNSELRNANQLQLEELAAPTGTNPQQQGQGIPDMPFGQTEAFKPQYADGFEAAVQGVMNGGNDATFDAITQQGPQGPSNLFNGALRRASNPGLDGRFTNFTNQGASARKDGIFDSATRDAQGRQYADGFQGTLNEMQDRDARFAAFDRVKENVADDVMQNVNSVFAGSGMTGSEAHRNLLAKGLSSGLASVENDAMQRMQDRALSAAQIGQNDLNQQRQFGMNAASARQGAMENARARQLQAGSMFQDARNARDTLGLNAANMDQQAAAQRYAQQLQAAGLRQDALTNNRAQTLQGAGLLNEAFGQDFARKLAVIQGQQNLGAMQQDAYNASLAAWLGAATGNRSQTSTTSNQPGIGGILSAASGIASLFSDARLKTDVKRVGQMDDGTPIYTYRYKDGVAPEFEGKTLMGVMSGDVPHATVKDASGFDRVNYGAL